MFKFKITLLSVYFVCHFNRLSCDLCTFRYFVIASYPPNSTLELEIKPGDIVYVTKKIDNGWFHGTLERNGKVGFVPSSFLQKV